jgi:hypothetical protein
MGGLIGPIPIEMLAAESEGSGALHYLRNDLFSRAAIHTYMPADWVPPGVRWNSLTVEPLVVVTSSTRHLTLREQRVMHAALRRSAKLIHKAVPHA